MAEKLQDIAFGVRADWSLVVLGVMLGFKLRKGGRITHCINKSAREASSAFPRREKYCLVDTNCKNL